MRVDWSAEETDDPLHANRPNFYKVEKWINEAGPGAQLTLSLCCSGIAGTVGLCCHGRQQSCAN